jgi:hypothetical protein
MAYALALAFLYWTVRRATYYPAVGELSHLRTVDETFRTTEDEEIIEKGRDEAAAARTDDRTPDPIMVTKCEHCPWDRQRGW